MELKWVALSLFFIGGIFIRIAIERSTNALASPDVWMGATITFGLMGLACWAAVAIILLVLFFSML